MNGGEFLTEPRPSVLCTAASNTNQICKPVETEQWEVGVTGLVHGCQFGLGMIYIYQ